MEQLMSKNSNSLFRIFVSILFLGTGINLQIQNRPSIFLKCFSVPLFYYYSFMQYSIFQLRLHPDIVGQLARQYVNK